MVFKLKKRKNHEFIYIFIDILLVNFTFLEDLVRENLFDILK